MKQHKSTTTRPEPVDPAIPLTHLSVRELLQQLTHLEDALRPGHPRVAPPVEAQESADRRVTLLQQARVIRELRRRRHRAGPSAAGRRRSAAWPPPPW
jgi:hypothetical protein